MIFLVLSGKMIFLFPEKMIVFFRRKMKDNLSRKKYMEIWYFLQMFWKDGLFKKIVMEYDLSSIIWKDGIFFPKIRYWAENERWSFSRNTWKYVFFCTCAQMLQKWCDAPLPKINQRWSSPQKIHFKVIDILGWHSRKSSNESLYFYGDLYRRFHTLLSSEKTRKLSI